MSNKNKESGGMKVIVGSLITFLFSNVFLLIYGLFKTPRPKRK